MTLRTYITALQLVLLCSIVSHAEPVEETMNEVIIEHIIFKDLSGKYEQQRLAQESADLEGPVRLDAMAIQQAAYRIQS